MTPSQLEAAALELYPQDPQHKHMGYPLADLADLQRAAYLAGATDALAETWISVEDRLPDPTSEAILLVRHFCENKNYYEVTKWDGVQINSWTVTHWQPLPSPPINQK